MPRAPAILAASLLAIILLPSGTAAHEVSTSMTGAAEVPGPGDPDGSGTATIMTNPGTGQVCWTIHTQGLENFTGAHIHVGDTTVAGPIVVPLTTPVDGHSQGCTTVDRALAKDIHKDPEDYYVNVHTTEFPRGAIRGQLG